MTSSYSHRQQLEILLRRYPNDPVDIAGVVLDYMARSGASLYDVLMLNARLYVDLFAENKDLIGEHLLLSQMTSTERVRTLRNACHRAFPAVTELLDRLEAAQRLERRGHGVAPGLFADPRSFLGHGVDAVVWQISDVHFGKYNVLEKNPRGLAALLAKAAVDFPALRPTHIVVSGDVTSIASVEEFEAFTEFCAAASEMIWGHAFPHRILVVPGNHDASWQCDGTADKMERFREKLGDSKYCITPFGAAYEDFDNGNVAVRRIDPHPDSVPPLASVTYKDYELEFILFVSGYFSGAVPSDVRTLIGDAPSREKLQEILRVDKGAVNREYLLNVSRLELTSRTRLGVIHHNPCQYGTEPCVNELAPLFLETILRCGVSVLLHGHVHLSEDLASIRPIIPGQTYPIPCPTLASIPTSGERGMNVHVLGHRVEKRMTTLLWEVSTSSDFKREGLRVRYTISEEDGGLSVDHGWSPARALRQPVDGLTE